MKFEPYMDALDAGHCLAPIRVIEAPPPMTLDRLALAALKPAGRRDENSAPSPSTTDNTIRFRLI